MQRRRNLTRLLLCFGGEEFATLGDEAPLGDENFLLRGGQVEDFAGAGWELGEGEGGGGVKFALPFGVAEDVPTLGGDPMDASHVRGGDEAFDLDEFGVAVGAGGVGEDAVGACPVGIGGGGGGGEGEKLGAGRLFPHPEDE